MRLARGLGVKGHLVTGLLALLLLASSCEAQAVKGFAWKDAAGTPIAFAQSAAWPQGEEGRFSDERRSNRYSPQAGLELSAGSSIIVTVKRAGPSSATSRIELSASAKPSGASPFAGASFPLLAERASFILPIEASSRLAVLGLSADGPGLAFSVESIAVGPSFRGIDGGSAGLRVSAGFSLAKGPGYQELSIARPFSGLGAASPAVADSRAGLLLEYGPAPSGARLSLEARADSSETRRLAIQTHPEGSRTVLDPGLLPLDTELLVLRVPDGVEVKAFYAAELGKTDFELADLGRVLLSTSPLSGYALYRWDLLPSVLIFDFQDYSTQDRYLKRLAFFVEKIGFRGTLAKDEAIASLHGWNAHDYRPEDLAAFFLAAKEKSFPLNQSENELRDILLREGVIKASGKGFQAGKGAIISIARESGEALRRTFAVHESAHAVFFSDAAYRGFARSLWSSLGPEEKWFWKTYLGWAAYDVSSDYLMGNEFQAYLLQQPVAAAEEYFTKRKSAELLEKHPELRERVAAYMAEFGTSFADRARELEAWLDRKYGIKAGNIIFLTPSR